MIRDKKQKYQVSSLGVRRISIELLIKISLLLLLAFCLYPEISLASATVEGQLDKVGALANGKIKTIGFSTAAILGGIGAMVKGNPKLAGIIVVIGVVLSLYFEWIAGGMKLMN
jgi:hypothetical protein